MQEVVPTARRGIDGWGRTRTAGSRCEREGTGHRLELWGPLPPAWAGHLALHLYACEVRIVNGRAERDDAGHWAARLFLQPADPRRDLPFDFMTMARRAPQLVPPFPRAAVSVGLIRSKEPDAAIFARVVGRDSIGLMAELLRRFERRRLRPRRFCLETRGDSVEDWFWLESIPRAEEVPTPPNA